ncbi:MAG: NAD-dependent epimerase/dehydratase family protein [bacterium]|nr:NAD-dependent epimerase/dehydratase family protein [bacterium]MDZ4286203.1 NAD-dependent epimerase/dehydratase family protein [Candidatus Sungbacteria bacterium]
MKKALVLGAGGFIGHHLVKRLKNEGYWVKGVDMKMPEFSPTVADEFVIGDLRDYGVCDLVIAEGIDEMYQLAADMGGAGYIFSGDHDADVMHNSAAINLNVAHLAVKKRVGKLFYSSSACIYPEYNQLDPENPKCSEESAYPAAPNSEYGWEKLFSERLYLSFSRNYGLQVRIARFHNTFGPEGAWQGGREKSQSALCRKIAEARDGDELEVWGDGLQTRSFLYIDECVEGVRRLMESDFTGPVNIGSDEMVSINQLVDTISDIAGKKLIKKYDTSKPQGVRGRNSDNMLIERKLGWKPNYPLRKGIEQTYRWIEEQIKLQNADEKNHSHG